MFSKFRPVKAPTFDPVVWSFSILAVALQRRDHLGNVVDNRDDAWRRVESHCDVSRVGENVYESGQDSPAI